MKICPKCGSTFEGTIGFCPKDGEVLEERTQNLVGQTLDNQYQVEAFIAQGGMGAVYRARHILLGDSVVIKTMRDEVRNNAEFLRRFQREGRAARSFRHPNSVTVYDLRTTPDGMIYMVMEYVEGHTLDKELKARGRFTPIEALEVLEPVASVLDAAHARGVVHRDLKPENVMLGKASDGHTIVKVLDLGIAKMLGAGDAPAAMDGTSLTVAGQILGTPYYMSPEQWGEVPRDGNPEIDGRADIYSLGVMSYELIAGKKPLGGRTLSELRNEHVAAKLVPLNEVVPEVPEAFVRAVERAMAKDRADRYPTAGEFTNDLRLALGLAPLSKSGTFNASQTQDAEAVSKPIDTSGGAASSRGEGAATTALAGGKETSVGRAPVDPNATVAMYGGGQAAGGAANGGGAGATSVIGAERKIAPEEKRATDTAPSVITKPQETSQSPTESGSRLPLVIGGSVAAIVLLAVIAGVVYFFALKPTPNVNVNGNANVTPSPNVNGNKGNAPAANGEAMQYWLETFAPGNLGAGARKASATVTLYSGDKFAFNFKPREKGYIYLLGPGEKNAPTTFITSQLEGGLTNEVQANSLFKFPRGLEAATLDNNPGLESYTVIFSPTPLDKPAFLKGKAGHKLTEQELVEFENFRAQTAKSPDLVVKDEGGQPFVSVVAPNAGGQPIVFDIRIDHHKK